MGPFGISHQLHNVLYAPEHPIAEPVPSPQEPCSISPPYHLIQEYEELLLRAILSLSEPWQSGVQFFFLENVPEHVGDFALRSP